MNPNRYNFQFPCTGTNANGQFFNACSGCGWNNTCTPVETTPMWMQDHPSGGQGGQGGQGGAPQGGQGGSSQGGQGGSTQGSQGGASQGGSSQKP